MLKYFWRFKFLEVANQSNELQVCSKGFSDQSIQFKRVTCYLHVHLFLEYFFFEGKTHCVFLSVIKILVINGN